MSGTAIESLDDASSPADRLRRLTPQVRALGEDGQWLADRFADYLAGTEHDLDRALGLTPGPGQRRPSTVLRHAERDRLVRAAAQEFFPGVAPAEQARRLADALGRYRAGSDWRRDRTAPDCPYRGTLRGHLWAVLRAVDRPLKERSIRAILAAS